MSPAKSPPIANELLAALPKKEYQALQSQMEEIPLVFEEILYRPEALISDVYFPNHGVISLLAGLNERATLEVGLVGKEGVLGLAVFMGVNASHNRAVVQGAGSAMKMKAAAFRRECNNGGALPRVLQRYTHSLLTQITQTAVCNQFHSIEARLARWLLMTHDRIEADEFQLTQEFLSNMLAVRRECVNKAAGKLQKRNLIRYSRGRLKVLDRAGLERISCGCYEIIKDESSRS
ncbi:MAG TPA: Crp/Fnr family transcriptional regulator [Pyrinomonadaceae bacterium]|nr:Crp/Fnr family transcriptional regulator [Pyrinomonadaceae bacterium]